MELSSPAPPPEPGPELSSSTSPEPEPVVIVDIAVVAAGAWAGVVDGVVVVRVFGVARAGVVDGFIVVRVAATVVDLGVAVLLPVFLTNVAGRVLLPVFLSHVTRLVLLSILTPFFAAYIIELRLMPTLDAKSLTTVGVSRPVAAPTALTTVRGPTMAAPIEPRGQRQLRRGWLRRGNVAAPREGATLKRDRFTPGRGHC